jgi:L-lactate dehydrogenase complex protein LldF
VAGSARAHGSDEVIKVKSLATDEIKLNEALAERGIAALETDLAELIIQLGDDEQSHILARRSTATGPRSASCSGARCRARRR